VFAAFYGDFYDFVLVFMWMIRQNIVKKLENEKYEAKI